MEFSFFFLFGLLSLVSQVAGQSLMRVLSTNDQLSTLFHYVNGSSSLTRLFNSIEDFTLLAPANSAFKDLLKSRDKSSISNTEIEELVQYHLLHGNFPTKSWTAVPQFASTFLDNSTYTNVTTGQVVELVLDDEQNPQILSWNRTATGIVTKDIACTNGRIQIIPKVLTVPQNMGSLFLTPTFRFFYAGLLEAGIASPSSADQGGDIGPAFTDLVVNQINATDVTFFVPNSAEALQSFTNLTSHAQDEKSVLDILKYHIVVHDLVYGSDFKDGMELTTTSGKNLSVKVVDGTVMVNHATITTSDYLVANGVVHVIDGLLSDTDDIDDTVEPPTPSTTSPATPTPTPAPKSSSSKVKVAVGVTVAVVLVLAMVAGFLLYRRMKKPTILETSPGPPERTRSYVHHDIGGNKVNRLLGQDLQLDPPLLSNQRFFKATVVELDSTPIESPTLSRHPSTVHEFPSNSKRLTSISNSTTVVHEFPARQDP